MIVAASTNYLLSGRDISRPDISSCPFLCNGTVPGCWPVHTFQPSGRGRTYCSRFGSMLSFAYAHYRQTHAQRILGASSGFQATAQSVVRRSARRGLAEPTGDQSRYRHASFVADNRVIFNIGGNKYRLITHVNFDFRIVYIKFVGTHAEYDRIDPETI